MWQPLLLGGCGHSTAYLLQYHLSTGLMYCNLSWSVVVGQPVGVAPEPGYRRPWTMPPTNSHHDPHYVLRHTPCNAVHMSNSQLVA